MTLKKTVLLVIVFSWFFPVIVSAQGVSIQGNNEMRWADGEENSGGQDQSKRYFENRLNLDIYYQNILIGTRLTSLQPSEFGEERPSSALLEKRFLEYNNPNGRLGFRVGDFYTVWGRGLSIALVEDITQGFDSGLEGFLGHVRFDNFELEALSGRSRAGYLGDVREAKVNGIHAETAIPFGVRLGGQAVLLQPAQNISSYRETRDYGGYVAFDNEMVSLWIERLQEYVTSKDDDFDATYASLTTTLGSIGIALDYKNYNYYLASSIGQSNNPYSQSVNIIPFHSPPIVQREFTSNLFGKHPHIVRFQDEVGLQLELTYALGPMGTAILAVSQSSLHSTENAVLPSLAEEDSPYRQAFLEFNLYPDPEIYVVAWAGFSEELDYNTIGSAGRKSWVKRTDLGSKVEFPLLDEWTGIVYTEGLYVDDIKQNKSYFESLFTLGVIFRSNYNVTVTGEFTGDDATDDGRQAWFNVQGRAFIDDSHELLVMVGQERGGLVCTSGKCRNVLPFNGVKLTLTSLF